MNVEFEDILKVDKKLKELVRNWRNSDEIRRYMYTNHHITKTEHEKWIENLKTKNIARAWIIKYDGKPVGLVYLSNIDYKNKTTDWGFYIADESSKGKGVGSAALYKLMEYVFDEMNFDKMHTKVLENNPIAIKLYEKFGFKKDDASGLQLERDEKKIAVFKMSICKDEWNHAKEKLIL
jgi:UDP-4-amino-4,6-dideoxy-N-acetyl-beta-L-altrosamine N-acetyltransferase